MFVHLFDRQTRMHRYTQGVLVWLRFKQIFLDVTSHLSSCSKWQFEWGFFQSVSIVISFQFNIEEKRHNHLHAQHHCLSRINTLGHFQFSIIMLYYSSRKKILLFYEHSFMWFANVIRIVFSDSQKNDLSIIRSTVPNPDKIALAWSQVTKFYRE